VVLRSIPSHPQSLTGVVLLSQYLEENLAGANIRLSPEEVQEVRQAIGKAGLDKATDRYPPGMVDHLFVDSPPLKK
jgi:hypothetical protein